MRRKPISLFLMLLLAVVATGCLPGGSDTTSETAVAGPDRPPWQQIYTDITFDGPSLGLISGWHGTVLRSTDAGQTWSDTKVGSQADLNSVAILDSKIAIAVGSSGNILRSTDSGQTWSAADSPTSETLNRVRHISGNTAVAVGWHGTVLYTEDGGLTWNDQSKKFDSSLSFEDVSFLPSGGGLLVSSSGRVFRTLNSQDWQELTLPGQGNKLYAVDLLDPYNAFLAGNVSLENSYVVGGKTVILKTQNSGNDWQYSGRNMNADLLAIKFIDSQNSIAAGWNGDIWRTSDDGGNWQPIVSHTTQALRAMALADASTICAVGDGQTIITSRNYGFTWEKLRGA